MKLGRRIALDLNETQEAHATYQSIEDALDRGEAPATAPDGRRLKLHERVLASLAAEVGRTPRRRSQTSEAIYEIRQQCKRSPSGGARTRLGKRTAEVM